jgi:GT2 family glycosyltransferase
VKAVDVVIPVYDGYTETVACLESVLATVPPAWARIVVVNDASPEPRITAHLRDLKALWPQLVLLENDDNLGFVATANRGMRYDESRDVLLLNSDVEVCGDWLWRLREAAYHNERVGSITPFSNNATICSFPDFCKDNRLLFDLDPAHIDSAFTDLFDKERVFDIPTGVGC